MNIVSVNYDSHLYGGYVMILHHDDNNYNDLIW